MAAGDDDFLSRWSRRKREAGAKPAVQPFSPPATGSAAPELPPVDQLTPESEFKDFMHAKVNDGVRRAALKKLFADPRFNVIDQMDVYIDDYTNGETISAEMLAQLEHSKSTLNPPQPEAEKGGQESEIEKVEQAAAPAADAPAAEAPASAEPRSAQQEKKGDGAPG